MQPVVIEGRPYFLSGVRGSPAEPFSYLRIPADENGKIGYIHATQGNFARQSASAAVGRYRCNCQR